MYYIYFEKYKICRKYNSYYSITWVLEILVVRNFDSKSGYD